MVARKLTQEQIDVIPSRYAAGESSYALAREFGVSGACIRQHIRRGSIEVRPHGKLLPRLTEVLDRYVGGEGSETLAREFGVTRRAIRLRVIEGGQTMRTPSEASRYLPLRETAFSVMNPETAYWIGFLMADGSVNSRTNEIALRLASVDLDHVLAFRDFVGSGHKVIHIARNGYDGKTAEHLVFHSDRMKADLAKWGVTPRKTWSASAPECLRLDPDFWRGVVDGDGCLQVRKGRLESIYVVGTRAIAEQFMAFVKTHCDTKAKAAPIKGKSIWRAGVSGSFARKMAEVMYSPEKFALDRK